MKKLLIIVLSVFVLLFFYTSKQISVSDDEIDSILSDKKELVNKSNNMGLIESDEKTESQADKEIMNSTSNTLEPEIQQALENQLNTSSEGLVENKTENGYNVNLQGRFRSVPVATIKEDGGIYIKDYTSLPKKINK